ncbi:uncharacterized protein LOC123300094 [Chrysoperla carnea]|uniref:uncharacterized protein LOC123300094 n=1 Tax=Chrysoperla carnea TaxID=189513 RepID=UPI001D073552|nr:uncharacterized protein LOC123300094 [Chrysoperla carnea]
MEKNTIIIVLIIISLVINLGIIKEFYYKDIISKNCIILNNCTMLNSDEINNTKICENVTNMIHEEFEGLLSLGEEILRSMDFLPYSIVDRIENRSSAYYDIH